MRFRNTGRLPSLKRLLKSVGALLCLCAVLFAGGFHTVALQGYAWFRMYNAYSQSLPAATALELTLSGEELCSICVISQQMLDDVNDSLALSLEEQKPLVNATFDADWQLSKPIIPPSHGLRPVRTLIEVTLSADPPPPRTA